MANTCQASLRPAGALASSDQFVGLRAWDHKPSSTPKLNAGKIDQKKKENGFLCYIRMLAGSPREPLCYSVLICESTGFTAGHQHRIRGESDFPRCRRGEASHKTRRKASAGQQPSSVLRRGLPLHVHSCSAHGGLVLPGQTAWRSGQGSGRAVTAALRITAAVPNFQSPTAAD